MNKSTAIILTIGGLILGLVVGIGVGVYVMGKSQKVSQPSVSQPAPAISPEGGLGGVGEVSETPLETPMELPEIKEAGIQLTDKKLDNITSPVTVKGKANVFEGHVNLRVKDANDKVLGKSFATACMGETACPFEGKVSFSKPTTPTGTIEAYTTSPMDGKEADLVSIPVTFAK